MNLRQLLHSFSREQLRENARELLALLNPDAPAAFPKTTNNDSPIQTSIDDGFPPQAVFPINKNSEVSPSGEPSRYQTKSSVWIDSHSESSEKKTTSEMDLTQTQQNVPGKDAFSDNAWVTAITPKQSSDAAPRQTLSTIAQQQNPVIQPSTAVQQNNTPQILSELPETSSQDYTPQPLTEIQAVSQRNNSPRTNPDTPSGSEHNEKTSSTDIQFLTRELEQITQTRSPQFTLQRTPDDWIFPHSETPPEENAVQSGSPVNSSNNIHMSVNRSFHTATGFDMDAISEYFRRDSRRYDSGFEGK